MHRDSRERVIARHEAEEFRVPPRAFSWVEIMVNFNRRLVFWTLVAARGKETTQ